MFQELFVTYQMKILCLMFAAIIVFMLPQPTREDMPEICLERFQPTNCTFCGKTMFNAGMFVYSGITKKSTPEYLPCGRFFRNDLLKTYAFVFSVVSTMF